MKKDVWQLRDGRYVCIVDYHNDECGSLFPIKGYLSDIEGNKLLTDYEGTNWWRRNGHMFGRAKHFMDIVKKVS